MLTDAVELVADYAPKIVAPWELSFFIKSEIPDADCQSFALGNKGATGDFKGIKITMVEAFHSAGAQLTGFEGTNHFVGEAVGYIIEFENGLKVYHSGDTSLMGDMKTIISDFYKPDVAILPIGGVFTMGPDEAAHACRLISPKVVIPEHYGTFPSLVQTAEGFKKQVRKDTPHIKVLDVKPGVKVMV
jgi:L-ascorbate metabolism protein UlaG (beta-lactamase superfamily)